LKLVRLRARQIWQATVRAKWAWLAAASASALLLLAAAFVPPAKSQNPDTLMPEASTAKAKQILEQLITALGGPTYLDIRDSDCEGRLARFGHNGVLTG
jgi:hypothetical protein